MSKTTLFKVKATWFDDAEVTLCVNFDLLTPELAKLINDFLTCSEFRLGEEDEDVQRVVIRMFGEAAIRFFMDDGGAELKTGTEYRGQTERVLEFLYEGWPAFDDLGIVITGASVRCVTYDDVELESL